MSGKFVKVAPASEIPEGEARVYEMGDLNGESIALCNVGGKFYAIENLCTHDDGPLGEGTLEGRLIECPRHGARFDVTDGSVARMPAASPVRTFPVRVEGGVVYVEIEED